MTATEITRRLAAMYDTDHDHLDDYVWFYPADDDDSDGWATLEEAMAEAGCDCGTLSDDGDQITLYTGVVLHVFCRAGL